MKRRVACITVVLIVSFSGSSLGSAQPRSGHASQSATRAASAAAPYANALIADRALRYVGKPGWTACADAGRSGLIGGATPVQPHFDSNGKLVKEGDGQCRAFVNCIVWMASGHQQWLGGGANYFSSFLDPDGGPRGFEIKHVADVVKGDIVQQGANPTAPNLHTYVIVGRASRKTDSNTTRTFAVVDSNHDYKENVLSYARAITLGPNERAFRMGSAPGAQTESANASLTLAPSSSKAVVDRQERVRNGERFFLAAGKHTIVVSMPGFFAYSMTLYVVQSGSYLTKFFGVPAILIPRTAAGDRWLKTHPGEAARRRRLAGRTASGAEAFGQAVRQAFPVFTELPLIDKLFRVDYGISKRTPHDPTAIPAIFVSYYSPGGKKQAVAWLRFERYDPSKHEVYFRKA